MKKQKNKNYNTTSSGDTNEIYKMLKIFIVLVILFFVIYFGYALLTGEFSKKDKEEEPVEFQNVEILAGSTFKMDAKDYIVFFVDYESDDYSLIDIIRSHYIEEDGVRSYLVDTSKKINEDYVVTEEKEANKKPTTAKDLKVYQTTMIRIKNGKVVQYIMGVDKIQTYIEGLIKDEKK